MNDSWDMIIVGAGLAGLRIGIETLKKDKHIRCCILEQYDYVGGRVFTFRKHVPKVGKISWESGAGRISKDHNKVLDLIQSYDLHTAPIHSEVEYLPTSTMVPTENHFSDLISVYLDPLRALDPSVLAQYTLGELLCKTIGVTSAKKFYVQFPYFSEIHCLRADLALESFHSEMSSNKGFFVCKEGLSSLTDAMHQEFVKRGGTVQFHTTLKKVCYCRGVEELHCTTDNALMTYVAPIVVLALHHTALKQIDGVRTYDVLRHLEMQPLLRMYAIFPTKHNKSWFLHMPHTVTDSPIRYIIPIDPVRGIIMISYTDGGDTRHWKNHKDNEMRVMQEIRRLFPDRVIPEPIYFKEHLWGSGCTYWKPGAYDVQEASRQSLHPMPHKFPGLFMCGESFAVHQCWMESALDQADKLLKHPDFCKCVSAK
jgi:phytoene dehydrogenase-like protein